MKYIKTYKIFENSNSKLISKLVKYDIQNYTINDDQTIDVDGHIELILKELKIIPFKFNKVSGSFDCFNNNLNSLEGSPLEVGGNFDCSVNDLNSLSGSPIKVNENFKCAYNNLKKLQYAPSEVGGSFDCSNNQLESLEGCPIEVGNNFNCSFNQLNSLEYCPSEIENDFYCTHNYLSILDCSSYVKGDIFCYGNGFIKEPEFFGDCEGKIIWR